MPLYPENSSTRETERRRLYYMHSCLDDLWGYYLGEHPLQTQSNTTVKELLDWCDQQTLLREAVKES